ncbi:MAG: DsbC family protein [Wenzhouxiangellaceae bacterium]|nr:DsbC family protein [Wenzhouxiangellaceae bacterium]
MKSNVFILGLALAAGCTTLHAADYQAVRDRLETLVNTDAQVSIAELPIEGVLQVRIGPEIVYMTEDARYLLQGRLVDLETRSDLTEEAKGEVRKELVGDLKPEDMIRFGPEDAEHDIIVFTDVDCGYCRRLHQQIQAYNDAGIRISYAAFPRAGIGSQTFRKMTSVWCAADPHEAMDIAKAGETPPPAECESPVSEQYKLGQAIGVTGTPALVTSGGDLIPGYVAPDDLKARLEQLEERRTAD